LLIITPSSRRGAARKDHYLPASLVDRQFAAREPPEGQADVIAMPAEADPGFAIPGLATELARR